MSSLSIIVASSGRSTLPRALASVTAQLQPGDELLVDVNDNAPWGHRARNRMMPRARGDHLLFLDDDNIYLPDALATIRRACAAQPQRLHIFRAGWPDGTVLWRTPHLQVGNVDTLMVCVPNRWQNPPSPPAGLPEWGERYEGDYDFISGCAQTFGAPAWHEPLIGLYRPAEDDSGTL
jgi:hypothetical protein